MCEREGFIFKARGGASLRKEKNRTHCFSKHTLTQLVDKILSHSVDLGALAGQRACLLETNQDRPASYRGIHPPCKAFLSPRSSRLWHYTSQSSLPTIEWQMKCVVTS